MKFYLIAMFTALTFAANLNAQTVVTTEFGLDDGFTTGGTDDVVVGGLVTFSGGQQQQGFLGAAYNKQQLFPFTLRILPMAQRRNLLLLMLTMWKLKRC